MNKILKLSWVTTVASVVLPLLASAQGPGLPSAPANTIGGVFNLICTIFGYLFYVLVLATIFFVIMAAFKYLTAAGDPEKVKMASHQLLYAAVAIVVGILARVLPGIAASLVGTSGVGAC